MRLEQGSLQDDSMTAFVSVKESTYGKYAEYGVTQLGNQVTCQIATEADDVISIEWGFSNTTEQVVELVVDGIVRQSSSSSGGNRKHHHGDFKTVWKCRVHEKTGKVGAAQLCSMKVITRRTENDRNPTVLANNGDKISDVGSIEIRVLRKIPLDSSASSSKTAATVLPTFMTATNWWDYSRRVEVPDSQIVPGYQICFTDPQYKASTKSKAKTLESRAEYFVWASFKILYRSIRELRDRGFTVPDRPPKLVILFQPSPPQGAISNLPQFSQVSTPQIDAPQSLVEQLNIYSSAKLAQVSTVANTKIKTEPNNNANSPLKSLSTVGSTVSKGVRAPILSNRPGPLFGMMSDFRAGMVAGLAVIPEYVGPSTLIDPRAPSIVSKGNSERPEDELVPDIRRASVQPVISSIEGVEPNQASTGRSNSAVSVESSRRIQSEEINGHGNQTPSERRHFKSPSTPCSESQSLFRAAYMAASASPSLNTTSRYSTPRLQAGESRDSREQGREEVVSSDDSQSSSALAFQQYPAAPMLQRQSQAINNNQELYSGPSDKQNKHIVVQDDGNAYLSTNITGLPTGSSFKPQSFFGAPLDPAHTVLGSGKIASDAVLDIDQRGQNSTQSTLSTHRVLGGSEIVSDTTPDLEERVPSIIQAANTDSAQSTQSAHKVLGGSEVASDTIPDLEERVPNIIQTANTDSTQSTSPPQTHVRASTTTTLHTSDHSASTTLHTVTQPSLFSNENTASVAYQRRAVPSNTGELSKVARAVKRQFATMSDSAGSPSKKKPKTILSRHNSTALARRFPGEGNIASQTTPLGVCSTTDNLPELEDEMAVDDAPQEASQERNRPPRNVATGKQNLIWSLPRANAHPQSLSSTLPTHSTPFTETSRGSHRRGKGNESSTSSRQRVQAIQSRQTRSVQQPPQSENFLPGSSHPTLEQRQDLGQLPYPIFSNGSMRRPNTDSPPTPEMAQSKINRYVNETTRRHMAETLAEFDAQHSVDEPGDNPRPSTRPNVRAPSTGHQNVFKSPARPLSHWRSEVLPLSDASFEEPQRFTRSPIFGGFGPRSPRETFESSNGYYLNPGPGGMPNSANYKYINNRREATGPAAGTYPNTGSRGIACPRDNVAVVNSYMNPYAPYAMYTYASGPGYLMEPSGAVTLRSAVGDNLNRERGPPPAYSVGRPSLARGSSYSSYIQDQSAPNPLTTRPTAPPVPSGPNPLWYLGRVFGAEPERNVEMSQTAGTTPQTASLHNPAPPRARRSRQPNDRTSPSTHHFPPINPHRQQSCVDRHQETERLRIAERESLRVQNEALQARLQAARELDESRASDEEARIAKLDQEISEMEKLKESMERELHGYGMQR